MKTLILLIILILPNWLFSQQIADTTYNPVIQNPEYGTGKESVVFIDEVTSKFSVEGWSQGAYKKYGKGRVVAFGEAAMFTAQIAGPNKIKRGMNNEVAPENYQLLLNIIHWLDGKIE